jgi:hypothetical protein
LLLLLNLGVAQLLKHREAPSQQLLKNPQIPSSIPHTQQHDPIFYFLSLNSSYATTRPDFLFPLSQFLIRNKKNDPNRSKKLRALEEGAAAQEDDISAQTRSSPLAEPD